MTGIDLSTMTDEELSELRAEISEEEMRRSIPAQIEMLQKQYRDVAHIEDFSEWKSPAGAHDAVPPGGVRRFSNGKYMENISGVALVHGPEEYPRGWRERPAPPDTSTLPGTEDPVVEPWSLDTSYATGDVRSYGSVEYICRQAHRSQRGWEPPNVPALWNAR